MNVRQARSHYNKIIWTTEKVKQEEFWGKLFHAAKSKNQRAFWTIVKEATNLRPPQPVSNITENLWIQHLEKLYDGTTHGEALDQTVRSNLRAPDLDCSIMDPEEIALVIKTARWKRAPGPNGVPNAVYKQNSEYWSRELSLLFSEVIAFIQVLEN